MPEIPVKKQKATPKKSKIQTAIKKKPVVQEKEQKKEEIEKTTEPVVFEEEVVEEEPVKPIVKKVVPPKPKPYTKPYSYYLNHASLSELSAYISNKATKNSLSYTQYNMLSRRKVLLQEERLFKHGSLEELIAAYKVNKNPKYKQRIMSLMKAKQAHH